MKTSAVMFLCLALAGSAMAIESPFDFITVNQDSFKVLSALLAKANPAFTAALKNSTMAGTYFLPTDAAIVYSAANCWTDTSNSSLLTGPSTADVVAKVATMDTAKAGSFIQAHGMGVTVANVSALNDTNSTSLTFTVSNDAGYLAASVATVGNDSQSANIYGPAAIPAGQATVFLIDSPLADVGLISGEDCTTASAAGAGSASDSAASSAAASLSDANDTSSAAAESPSSSPPARKLLML